MNIVTGLGLKEIVEVPVIDISEQMDGFYPLLNCEQV
jgi:hypothetical protein